MAEELLKIINQRPNRLPISILEFVKAIIDKEAGNLRKIKTLNAIQLSFDSLKHINGKVTQKMVGVATGFSLRNIKSYWNEMKK